LKKEKKNFDAENASVLKNWIFLRNKKLLYFRSIQRNRKWNELPLFDLFEVLCEFYLFGNFLSKKNLWSRFS
jgi:hypothetical protein